MPTTARRSSRSTSALLAGERPARSSVLIRASPYEAVEVRTDRFDPDDAAVAAEQLAAAQQHAAELEAAAIERGRAELVEREAAIDLAVETRSTAAASRARSPASDEHGRCSTAVWPGGSRPISAPAVT